MTLPNGAAGVNPHLQWGVGLGELQNLPARTQDAVTAALQAQVQVSAAWTAASAAVYEGLRAGINYALAIIEAIVQRLFNTVEQFPGVAQALDFIQHVPGVQELTQAMTGVVGDLSDLATYVAGKWNTLAALVNDIADFIAAAGQTALADVGTALVNAANLAQTVNTAITTLITNVGGTVIGDVSTAINTAATDAGNAISQLNDLIVAAGGVNIGDVATAITNAANGAAAATADLVDLIAGMGAADIHSLVTGLLATANAADNAVNDLTTLITGVLGGSHTVADLVAYLNAIPGSAIAGITAIEQAILDAIANALGHSGSGHTPSDIQGYLANIPGSVVSGITGGLQTTLDAIANALGVAGTGHTPANVQTYLGAIPGVNLTGPLNTAVTIGGQALSSIFNGSGQFIGVLNSAATGALNTAVTVGGTSLSTLFTNINSSGQLLLSGATGALNTAVTIGGQAVSSLFNGSGQFIGVINSAATGALNTALTLGGTSLSTLFTNINSSGQLLGAGITGAINTAATVGGTALGTLATNWNAAVTNVNSLISGVSGASTAADVATNINLAATNIAQIGTAAQNAAAGVVGSLNAAATQVQTAFSGILNGLFGGLTGQPSPANYSQAQVDAAAASVITNNVGNAATFVGVQNAEAAKANLMSVKFNFGDYGSAALPGSFTLSNDNAYYAGTSGSIEIVDGRAVYKKSGTGTGQKIARYNVAPTATNYQEISWVHTGDQDSSPSLMAIYARMNSAATSYLKFELNNGDTLSIIAVVAGTPTNEGSFSFDLRPGAKYTIKCGDLTQARDIFLYENDVLVRSVGTSAAHQVGASYRYAGFGFSGVNTGTQPHNFGINVFSVADQVFKPGPAATAYVSTSETTTSTSYTDLTTTSDTVTATIGSSGMALVLVSANLQNNTQASRSYMSFAVSGATTQAAVDSYSIGIGIPAAVANMANHSGSFLVTGLNPGSNTFKAKYRVSATTGTFADRRIAVIPL